MFLIFVVVYFAFSVVERLGYMLCVFFMSYFESSLLWLVILLFYMDHAVQIKR
jgi:hypothetical protein